ncbi:MAG: glycosyltransferase family 4 protein [Bacteroidota bacterium]
MFKKEVSCFFAKIDCCINKKSLNILHISSALSWRGGERQISFLVQELKKKGINQKVLCAKGSQMELWCKNNNIEHFSYRKIFSLNPLVAYKIFKLSKKNKFSFFHTHDSHSHTFAVLAVSLFKIKIPIIVHRRVDFPIKNNFLSQWKYNHPSIKAIICTSHFIKKLIAPSIRSRATIYGIHSGINLQKGNEDVATDLRSEFGILPSTKIVVNLAAIAPHKDYFTFVDTAEILINKGVDVHFLLIGGDGGEASMIDRYIRKKKLENKMNLTGHRKDVTNILKQSDLMLFTSKTEGLGGATLDALLAGTPVVSTEVGGVMEIIENGVTGLTAPVGDAKKLADQVIQLLADNELQNKLIKNGKEKTKYFSREENAEKILKVYNSI